MAAILMVVYVVGSLFLTPFLMLLLCIIFLASIGKSLGVRRLYIKILLMIFEYGRANIEVAQNKVRKNEDDEDEWSLKEPLSPSKQIPESPFNFSSQPVNGLTKPKNGYVNQNGNSLISRDGNLILVPEPPSQKVESNIEAVNVSDNKSSPEGDNIMFTQNNVVAGMSGVSCVMLTVAGKDRKHEKYDFKLSNCFDYIVAGMESIIEDQVTSRFEAEELKNWNLLTRTNTNYEFISWKLTVIWMCGFIIRYFFLFPLRVIICFIGISWLWISTYFIGLLPDGDIKRWVNHYCYIMAYRIIIRSVTGMITIYNKQYRPKYGGVCVANHTTPVDVAVLSVDNCFCLVLWLTICTAMVGYVSEGPFKEWLNRKVSMMCFGILSSALSSVITYHNQENRPKNGICVANHTSPIDVLVLMCDNCYSLIGQRHGGFLGILQRALARASPHIWFERSEVRDRNAVAKRLREHVSNPNNPPILIFPEGTCINNTSVMQFKKGSFEVGSVIYPVAIKYDPKFGDAFWNSSRYSMLQYLYMMMTSWAIVCEVWYLPPMYQEEGESAINFANRVKSVIAKQGGLVDLVWDGQLKRIKPKKEWREKQQEEFSKKLKI